LPSKNNLKMVSNSIIKYPVKNDSTSKEGIIIIINDLEISGLINLSSNSNILLKTITTIHSNFNIDKENCVYSKITREVIKDFNIEYSFLIDLENIRNVLRKGEYVTQIIMYKVDKLGLSKILGKVSFNINI
jgi:hypothetical protein